VIVQNYRQDVAERLGISYEQVRARRPDIIYASLNAYGQGGPFAGRPVAGLPGVAGPAAGPGAVPARCPAHPSAASATVEHRAVKRDLRMRCMWTALTCA
jgi:hypothetical protein